MAGLSKAKIMSLMRASTAVPWGESGREQRGMKNLKFKNLRFKGSVSFSGGLQFFLTSGERREPPRGAGRVQVVIEG
jgi:hypothetical protein